MSQSISPPAWLPFRRLPAAVLSALWMVPIAACVPRLEGQSASNVLLVVNRTDPVSQAVADYYAKRRPVPARQVCLGDRICAVSQAVADYYAKRRPVPARQVCLLETTSEETIDW